MQVGQRSNAHLYKSTSPPTEGDSNHSTSSHNGPQENEIFRTWCPHFQFQSHDPDFDYLKSVEIEEKINQIKFLPQINNNLFILSTNGMYYVLCTNDVECHTYHHDRI